MKKELPGNWAEVQLRELLEVFENGSRPKGGVQGILEGTPSLGGEHLSNDGGFKFDKLKFVPITFAQKMKRGLIKENDILIVKDGATTGKTSFVSNLFPYNPAYVNEHVFICRPFSVLNQRMIFYYLFSKEGQKRILNNFTGSAQGGINQKFANNTLIPIPPFPEQDRIVAKLDKLFEQLEVINTSLERVPILLKNFRQQVLTQAVTGKLTEEWRKGKELGEWKLELAKDCCEKVQSGGTPKGSKFSTSGIPFFKVYNIVDQQISFEYKPQFISEDFQNSQCKKSKCYPGDVLMNIVGPPLNKVAIVPARFDECNINQAITLFRPKLYLHNKFLYYFLREGTPVNNLVNETRGVVGQINISLTQCREFEFPIPTPKEQKEIVSQVESLFAKADSIEEQYNLLRKKIDILPQSILHKAFKGELLAQLESDGDARELLEEIMKLKEDGSAKTVKGKRKSKKYETRDVELSMAAEVIDHKYARKE